LAAGWIVVGTVRRRTTTTALGGLQLDLQLADMLRPRDLERVVKATWRTYGRLDAMVCNAGYGLLGPVEKLEYAKMTEQLAVNSLAPAELIRQAVPLMRRQGYGVIVGMSSIVGRTGVPDYSLYSASKFALEGLFESLAMELMDDGIRFKLVEPSGVNTPFWNKLHDYAPANRTLTPEKVAAVVVHAATDRSLRLRYPMGQTWGAGLLRWIMPGRWYLRIMRRIVSGH
jgi:NAD(P)-dependent dehydrogenase (short-subunit alcohol dehydrogenase family)